MIKNPVQPERKQMILDCRAGKYEAVVNVGVLTTGVDIKIIDCIVLLRATQSAALFVQACGRGLRVLEGKEDCLIIDLTDNFNRFGSLENPLAPTGEEQVNPVCSQCEAIRVPKDKNCWQCGQEFKKGTGPLKDCPQCKTSCQQALTTCLYCGHVFISHSIDYITDPKQKTGWFRIKEYSWEFSRTQNGEDCVIVYYDLDGFRRIVQQWLLFKRDWAGFHRKQIQDMLEKPLELVKIDDRFAKFPNVKGVLYKQGSEEPILPFIMNGPKSCQCSTSRPPCSWCESPAREFYP